MSRFTCLLLLSIVALCAVAATAAPPPQSNSAAPNPELQIPAAPVLPKCGVKYEISQDPVVMKATSFYLPSIGQKFVAEFEMEIAPDFLTVVGFNEQVHPEMVKLRDEVSSLLAGFGQSQGVRGFGRYLEQHPQNAEWKDGIAKQLLPPFFLTPEFRYRAENSSYPAFNTDITTVKLLTSDPETAKKVVDLLLEIYRNGLSLPEQKLYIADAKAYERAILDGRARAEELYAIVANDDKVLATVNLKEFEDITPASLETFRSQKRMLAVDRAGLKARVDACEKILRRGTGATLSVESKKIDAEVELAGVEAKLTEIERIIQGGQGRLDIQARVKKERSDGTDVDNRISQYEQSFKMNMQGIQLWTKCPIQGTVQIHPIKWESPKSE